MNCKSQATGWDCRGSARFHWLVIGGLGLLLAGCNSRPTMTGYWEGSGSAVEVPMKDNFKELRRSADFKFWFVMDAQGSARGEIELVYDAELKVENLPQMDLGWISFRPQVGGKLTDLDPRRRFPLVGVRNGDALTLQIVTADADRKPLEFTMRSTPGVGVRFGAGLGGAAAVTGPAGGAGEAEKIPMTPFTPFSGPAKIEKRPNGPFAATYEANSGSGVTNWSAAQSGGEQRQVEATPELERALRELRERLAPEGNGDGDDDEGGSHDERDPKAPYPNV